MKRNLLFHPDPPDDGGAPADTNGAPPPAAQTVINGQITEQNSELATELENEKRLRIERERRISELEDENTQLKNIPAAPVNEPTKRQKKKAGTRMTFFHPEEETED